jgi:glycosyltransferase involved in cell wall biosynthesis
MQTLISICIPAYRRVGNLKILLDCISKQTYENIEVVITDDSGLDNAVFDFLSDSLFKFKVNYYKNPVPLGSPRNWLFTISLAKGDWVKIMHDDDYFSSPTSLQEFVDEISDDIDCLFSGYNAVFDDDKTINKTISGSKFHRFLTRPFSLFAENVIGPPSVMMFKRGIAESFDERLKWIVDWEYYIRLSLKYKLKYISKPLICVGYNETQITNSCFLNPDVEIPETLIFTNKYGNSLFKNILAYDAWWRLLRNLGLRKTEQLTTYSKKILINENVFRMIQFQSYFKPFFLNIGFISKILMLFSYLFNRKA